MLCVYCRGCCGERERERERERETSLCCVDIVQWWQLSIASGVGHWENATSVSEAVERPLHPQMWIERSSNPQVACM